MTGVNRTSAATTVPPFLRSLKHTLRVMKRAHSGGGDRLMSIWTEDVQAVEEAIAALSSDGEPSNGKQPLMASRPAPPVPSEAINGAAQAVSEPTLSQVIAWLEARPGISWTQTIIDIRSAVEDLAAQPPAAPVETDTKSAPAINGAQNTAECSPPVTSDSVGADTRCSAGTAEAVLRDGIRLVNVAFGELAAGASRYCPRHERDKFEANFYAPAREWLKQANEVLIAEPQEAWQPIETAPKDGKRILLYQEGRGAFEGWWHTSWPHPEAYWMDDADSEPAPTYWQPTLALPRPPSSSCRSDRNGKCPQHCCGRIA